MYTEARKRANEKYMKENTDDIRLRVRKGTKERWRKYAEEHGYKSMTAFVYETVERKITKG